MRPFRWAVKRLRSLSVGDRRYVVVGIAMTGLNVGVLMVLVDFMGVPALAANVLRTVATTQIHFCIHRWYTWHGLDVRALRPFWQEWRRFHVLKAVSSAVQQFVFFLLVSMGVNHVITYLSLVAGLGIINFIYSKKLVFGVEGGKKEASPA